MARFQNILETIGNTPVVKLNRISPPGEIGRASCRERV